ncbi:Promethin [Oryzias melastigma]|uniref:Promethin n=2 Tax=Oryzias melastigma TaxID=30732 RepID=A0A3B3DCY9_ORYME|nr:lipid droplet assembly factor 1 isoform X2 [Oryzias melastigma]KAF6717509.1 Promethin [Oryzias melastigma]
MQRSSRLVQQLWERWTSLVKNLQEDPRVARLMTTRMGQYLSSHPFLALTLLMFSVMAALPVGIFFTFALVTAVISATGFVFIEVILLIVGGLTLLSILVGVALFSLLVSVVVNGLIISIPSQLKNYAHWAKNGVNQKTESETSGLKEL